MGPGISAFIMYIEVPDSCGIIAIIRTITPIPPTQWVKLRQNRVPWLSASTSRIMVAPVVVKPLAVSKKASIYDGISLEMTNGSAPMPDSTSHASATIIKPSRAYRIRSRGGKVWAKINPSTPAHTAGIRKEGTIFISPYISATSIGISSMAASSSII